MALSVDMPCWRASPEEVSLRSAKLAARPGGGNEEAANGGNLGANVAKSWLKNKRLG